MSCFNRPDSGDKRLCKHRSYESIRSVFFCARWSFGVTTRHGNMPYIASVDDLCARWSVIMTTKHICYDNMPWPTSISAKLSLYLYLGLLWAEPTYKQPYNLGKLERSEGKSFPRGKGFRIGVTWTYFHISALPPLGGIVKTTYKQPYNLGKYENCCNHGLDQRP